MQTPERGHQIVTVSGVSKTYGSGTRALSDLHLALAPGRFGLLGRNGAGKTTCLSILGLRLQPTSGSVSVFGHRASDRRGRDWIRRRLGFLDQAFAPPASLTGFEYVFHCGRLREPRLDRRELRDRVEGLLGMTGLASAAGKKAGGYSGGMKRRLGLCQALVHQPDLLILDEPTAGLDPEQRLGFRRLIRSLERTRLVILSSHIVEDIEQTCERLAVLHQGRLRFEGSAQDLYRAGRAVEPGCKSLEEAYGALLE